MDTGTLFHIILQRSKSSKGWSPATERVDCLMDFQTESGSKSVFYWVWCFEFLLIGRSFLCCSEWAVLLLSLSVHKAHRKPRNRLTLFSPVTLTWHLTLLWLFNHSEPPKQMTCSYSTMTPPPPPPCQPSGFISLLPLCRDLFQPSSSSFLFVCFLLKVCCFSLSPNWFHNVACVSFIRRNFK